MVGERRSERPPLLDDVAPHSCRRGAVPKDVLYSSSARAAATGVRTACGGGDFVPEAELLDFEAEKKLAGVGVQSYAALGVRPRPGAQALLDRSTRLPRGDWAWSLLASPLTFRLLLAVALYSRRFGCRLPNTYEPCELGVSVKRDGWYSGKISCGCSVEIRAGGCRCAAEFERPTRNARSHCRCPESMIDVARASYHKD